MVWRLAKSVGLGWVAKTPAGKRDRVSPGNRVLLE